MIPPTRSKRNQLRSYVRSHVTAGIGPSRTGVPSSGCRCHHLVPRCVLAAVDSELNDWGLILGCATRDTTSTIFSAVCFSSRKFFNGQHISNISVIRGSAQRGDRQPQASQKVISRIRTSVVKMSHGIMMTSTLILRTAGMSLSTFGSRSKNRWRLRKMYAPANKLMMKKKVAAIRRAVRAWGLICASIISGFASIVSQESKCEHFRKIQVF